MTHNTLVVMEAGVQDAFEHRIFKPLPPSSTPLSPDAAPCGGVTGERGSGEPGSTRETDEDRQAAGGRIAPRINLTFHVHL